MDWLLVQVGKSYRITYPNQRRGARDEGKVARVVRALPIGDFELEFPSGRKVTYHGTWLEPAAGSDAATSRPEPNPDFSETH